MGNSIKKLSVLTAIIASVTFASCNFFVTRKTETNVQSASLSGNTPSAQTTDNMANSKILVVVDLQKDFINGTLPAKNGADVINPIKRIIPQFDKVYFTLDWHPYNHCSFKAYGGIWPEHCVQHTEGASLPDGILEGLDNSQLRFLPKGNNPEREEYGQFEFTQADNQDLFRKGDAVVVCGIAAEYCVLETLKNLVRLSKEVGFDLSVFNEGVACIETNDPLLDYMKQNNIKLYK